MSKTKPIIYQLLPRLFTNKCEHCVQNGTIEQNGSGKLKDIDENVLKAIHALGVTHVWYTGVIEHATKTDYSKDGIKPCNKHVVKGNAGSPYAIRDYYDIDPDLAVNVRRRMAEFENLVERTHNEGLKVIIDFVPNHVAREYHSDAKPRNVSDLGENDNKNVRFSPDNNFYYIEFQQFSPAIDLGSGNDAYMEFPAKATGNDCFTAFPTVNDWYETVKLNYGVDYKEMSRHFNPIPSTWKKMLDILKFWADKEIDGFRCDMAHMVPVEFWHWAIPQVKAEHPDIIFIAEIYDVKLYRSYIYEGGFDYLYDKVTLYDTLRNIMCANVSAAYITNCWQTIDGINDHMLNFLENHDEQRIASFQFLDDAFRAIPALIVSATISRCPFMIYAGQELGEKATNSEGYSGYDGRTTIFDYWSVPTLLRWYNNGKCNTSRLTKEERALRAMYKKLMVMCNKERAIAEGDFFDLMYVNYDNINPHRHYVYMRHYGEETLLIAVNFGAEKAEININIPQHAFDCMKLSMSEYEGHELIGGEKKTFFISPISPFHTAIEPFNAVIWKLVAAKMKNS